MDHFTDFDALSHPQSNVKDETSLLEFSKVNNISILQMKTLSSETCPKSHN